MNVPTPPPGQSNQNANGQYNPQDNQNPTPQYVFNDGNSNQGGFVQSFQVGADGQSLPVNPQPPMPPQAAPVQHQAFPQQPVQSMQQPIQNQSIPTPPPVQPVQPMQSQSIPTPPPVQPVQPVMQPQMGTNQGMQSHVPPATNPPVPPAGSGIGQDDTSQEEDKTPANYQLGKYIKPIQHVKLPAHSLQINENEFLLLLAGSISLSKDEKKKIITSIPKLRQEQINELVRIFQEERRKFAELSQKHVAQLEKLAQQHAAEWEDIEMEYVAETKKHDEAQQADEIRKQLGL